MTKDDLYALVDQTFLTGGNRTQAAPARVLFKAMIDQIYIGSIKNYYGSTPPNNSNNASPGQGYAQFSRGYTTDGSVYECLQADETTATWVCIYGGGS